MLQMRTTELGKEMSTEIGKSVFITAVVLFA
jgi:hypothetical protein